MFEIIQDRKGRISVPSTVVTALNELIGIRITLQAIATDVAEIHKIHVMQTNTLEGSYRVTIEGISSSLKRVQEIQEQQAGTGEGISQLLLSIRSLLMDRLKT